MAGDYKNSGTLFKNEDKKQPNHADYNGSYTDEHGNEFWVSGWIKQGKTKKFISFTLKPKNGSNASTKSAPQQSEYDDEPF